MLRGRGPHPPRDLGQLVERLRRLDEGDVGARERAVGALDRLVEPCTARASVRAIRTRSPSRASLRRGAHRLTNASAAMTAL